MKEDSKGIFSLLNKSSSLWDLWTDLWELLIDSEIKDGILKELPGIKTVLALIDIKSTVSNYLWIKKFYWFINAFSQFSDEEKEDILRKADENKEILLEVLDKIESEHKPYFLWRIFLSFSKWLLTKDEFLRLTHIITTNFSWDLMEILKQKDTVSNLSELSKKSFNSDGIPAIEWLVIVHSNTYSFGDFWNVYSSKVISELWIKFISSF